MGLTPLEKMEAVLRQLAQIILPPKPGEHPDTWWAKIQERADLDPFQPLCSEKIFQLAVWLQVCEQAMLDRWNTYCMEKGL